MRELFRVLTFIAALCITAIGAMLGIAGIALGLLGGGPDRLTLVASSVSLLGLTMGLGAASAWHAWRAIRGYPSTAFRPNRVWLLIVLFVVALIFGQTILSLSLLPTLTFPLLHLGATILPGLIILALAGRALGQATTWRDIVLQMASGAFLATPLAIVLEGAIILLVASAAFLGVAWQPGGQDLILQASQYLEDLSWIQEPGRLAAMVLTPTIIAVAFGLVAGLIPVMEEAVKTIGVGLVTYRRPSLPQAVLWGLAAGAGFAAVEGLLNTAGALEVWLQAVLLRAITTLMHCMTGALMGLAWHQIGTRRSLSRGLAIYAGSVSIHGLWNGLAVIMTVASIKLAGDGLGEDTQALTGLGMLTMFLLQLGLAICLAGGLTALIIYIRRQSPAPVPARAQIPPASAEPAESDSGAVGE
jgi:hypothetical protein